MSFRPSVHPSPLDSQADRPRLALDVSRLLGANATHAMIGGITAGLATGSDSGTQGDNTTDAPNPVILGSDATSPGTVVTIRDSDDTTILGTATVQAGGDWSLVTTALSPGVHTLYATDSAGDPSTSIVVTVTAASGPIVIDVADVNQLDQAIRTADADTTSGHSYDVVLTGDMTENADLTAIRLSSGVSLTIDGQGHTLDGAGTYGGLFVYSGKVAVQDLTLDHTRAQGADGAAVAGGAAGLGGGLFEGSGGTVTLSGVTFVNDSAIGGNGHGGSGNGGSGGSFGNVAGFGVGGAPGFGSGGTGGAGEFGAGGGAGAPNNGTGGSGGQGGAGGFGGGGGGGGASGTGGVGGGGLGGFGGGNGTQGDNSLVADGTGGGGLGAGGDIFVQQGGSLTIEGGSLGAGTVAGGSGGTSGQALGDAIFLQGAQTLNLAPGAGQTLTIVGAIADEYDNGGQQANSAGLLVDGLGTVVLNGANSYLGGVVIQSGTLVLGPSATAYGNSTTGYEVAFAGTAPETLQFDESAPPNGSINGLTGGDTIVIGDFAYGGQSAVTLVSSNSIQVTSPTGNVVTLVIDGASGDNFHLAGIAGNTETILTLVAPQLIEGLAHDNGVSNTDGLTNDPALAGTSDTGGILTFKEAGTTLGTLAVTAGQAWNFLPTGLADGVHTITVSQTNSSGVTGTASTTFTLNTTAPAAPTGLALTAGSYSGTQGGVTDVANPTVTGTATANTQIVLYDGARVVGSTTSDGSGNWSLLATGGLTDGVNTLTAKAVSPAGEFSPASTTLSVTVANGTFNVATAAELAQAITTIDSGSSAGSYTVNFTADITETGNLPEINLASGITLTLNGAGHVLDGASLHRGLFVYDGTVDIENLTISDAVAQGASTGGHGGGAGAGLGGGLFIAGTNGSSPGGRVTLNNVTFSNDSAVGGSSGNAISQGGGGGMGGVGGAGFTTSTGGGGGTGGTAYDGTPGGAGGIDVLSTGGVGGGGAVGGFGAGGGGGGVGGLGGTGGFGGMGGFGAGGGAGGSGASGVGHPSHGGGGGEGGFGGGGGRGGQGNAETGLGSQLLNNGNGGQAGFGGGTGSGGSSIGSGGGGGGGGLGAGGDIFVQQGGSLTIEGGTFQAGTVTGGTGPGSLNGNGYALGNAIFLQGSQTQTFAPAGGQTLTINGAIADTDGSGAGGFSSMNGTGPAGLVIDGAGTVVLNAADGYVGGTTLENGTLVLGAVNATDGTGTSYITFAAPHSATLEFTGVNTPYNVIFGFSQGDTIAITDFAYSASDSVTINGNPTGNVVIDGLAGATETLTINGAGSETFTLSAFAGGGTQLTTDTAPPPPPPIVTEALTTDTGSSTSDDITANSALSGTAEANSFVTLTEGGSTLGTAATDGSGNWTYTPIGLSDGVHTIVASQTDNASQTGTATLTFTLETATPVAPASLALAAGSDSGTQGDGITDVTTPTITGTGTDGDTITLYEGNIALGSAIVTNGTWSIASTGLLLDGMHDLTATQTDVAGNVSASSSALALTIADGVIDVENDGDLNAAIADANAASAGQSYTIDVTNFIDQFVDLPTIDLSTGVGLTIDGAGNDLFGDGTRGLLVYAGDVTLQNLTLLSENAFGTTPVTGGGGGGGAAGLGGGLFVGAAGTVTLSNVIFTNDIAAGATGGSASSSGDGAPGGDFRAIAGFGMGGAGGAASNLSAPGSPGMSGGFGAGGGGGGSGVPFGPNGTEPGGNGGSGGFGGGGGGGGGGGAVASSGQGGAGGFGAGSGANAGAAGGQGGGGLGAGGDIFVQQGGTLIVEGGTLSQGAVFGGAGANPGSAFGSGIFLQGNQTQTFAPSTGQTLTIDDVIADQSGSGGTGNSAGPGGLLLNGSGTVVLGAANTFTGGIALDSGTLVLADPNAAGAGVNLGEYAKTKVVFGGSANATLAFNVADIPTNGFIDGFASGDAIVISDVAYDATDLVGVDFGNLIDAFDTTNTHYQFSAGGVANAHVALQEAAGGSLEIVIAPTVTEALTSDTGPSSSDDITSNAALTGTADPNAVVILSQGGSVIGTTTADNTGAWTYTPVGLADGAHTIVASDTNATSTTGTATLTFMLETATPAAPAAVTLDPGSDSGTQGDDVTNVAQPVITGTGTDGDTITLYDGSTVLGTAIVSGGTWSVTSGILLDGNHTLTATQTDAAGNVSQSSSSLALTIVDGIIDASTTPGLNAAIAAVNTAASGQSYTIELTGSVLETGNNTPIDLASGVTLTIDGNGNTLDGDSSYNGLFVYAGTVTVQDVTLLDSNAFGTSGTAGGGGGAGLGGGLFLGASADVTLDGVVIANGSAIGGGGGSASTTGNGGAGGSFGAIAGFGTGGAGGPAPIFIAGSPGQNGGFGAGGGGGGTGISNGSGGMGGAGGFGGGGGGGGNEGTNGGSGGAGGVGGFGAGSGGAGTYGGGGGGGLAAGGDIFVQQGGQLTIEGGSVGIGVVFGGSGGTGSHPGQDGSAFGDGIFIQGNQTVDLAPSAGQTLAINRGIADQTGSYGTGSSAGAGGIVLNGAGTVLLAGDDTYTGTTTLDSGTLVLGAVPSSSSIVFAAGQTATLAFAQVDAPVSTVQGFAFGDAIIISDLAYTATSFAAVTAPNVIGIGDGLGTVIDFGLQTASNGTFQVSAATGGGTKLMIVPVPAVTETLSNDTGTSASDSITSDPALSGSADANALVTLSIGGSVIGAATASNNGDWTYTPTGLADGVHTIVASDTNASSVTGTASLTFTLATSAAAPGALALAGGSDSGTQGDHVTNITGPTLTGTGINGALVTLYDGNTVLGTATVTNGIWSITSPTLATGTHSLSARQTDLAGNVSTAATYALDVDTTTPAAASTPVLDAGSDSGTQGDNITNVTTPAITGTGSNGDTVTLYDGMTAVGTATVVNGTWSITTSALANGAHDLHDTQTSPAGNVSAMSGTLALSINAMAPASASTPVLDAGSDSGVAGDGITNVTTPTITGTGVNGDIVKLYDGTTLLGTATVVNGTWSIATPTLSAGMHSLHDTQTDIAGNVSATSGTLALSIDTATPAAASAPVLDAGSDSGTQGDDTTNLTTPTITGTGVNGDIVKLYDGTTLLGTATVVNGAWSIVAPSLSSGAHDLHDTQTSSAGNVSAASGTLALSIDTATPAAASTPVLDAGSDSGTQGDDITNVTTPTITGTGANGDIVKLYDGATLLGTATVVNGAWSINAPSLSSGSHELHDTQTSPAGNVSAASGTLALSIDTAVPAAGGTPVLDTGSDSGVAGDGITNVTMPSITGTGVNGDIVKLYDGTTLLGTATVVNGTWSIMAPALSNGTHTLHDSQTDAAGNLSAASGTLALTIDTETPAAASEPVLSTSSDSGVAGDDITNVTTPSITGTGVNGDTVTLYDGTTAIGTATVVNGTWSITAAALGDGVHDVHDTQTSPAGNVSAASGTLALTIDTAPPAAGSTPVLSVGSDSGAAGDGITNVATPTITGTGVNGDVVKLYDGTTLLGTATVVNGTWSIASSMLGAGVHTLHDIQTDIAGNVSAASGTLALTIDTATPAAPAAPVLDAGSDSGVAGDGITNDTTPTMTGTGVNGDIITLYDGITAIGSATVVNGSWSITAPALADGVHDLHDTQTSPAGNVSAASGTLALGIDTATPDAASTPVLAGSSDSGVLGDGLTDIADPVIAGTGVTGDVVTLYEGTTILGTATVIGGTWSIAAGVLGNGLHHLHDVQTSPAGNVSAVSGTLALNIDTLVPATLAAPVLSTSSDSGVAGDDVTNVRTPVITGTGTDGDTVILYDGDTAVGTTTVVGGVWSITSAILSGGVHTLTSTQTNTAGTASASSQALAITIDTATPASASSPTLSSGSDSGVAGDDITNIAAPAISGSGINGDTVTLYDGTTAIGTATVVDGAWSIVAPALADGVHDLHDTQTSPAGNVSAASGTLALSIDTATPAAASIPALDAGSDTGTIGDDLTDDDTPTLTGTGIDGDTVTLYDGNSAIGTVTVVDGTWSIAASTLSDGVHTLTTTQTSPAGNVSASSGTLALSIDTVIPVTSTTPALSAGSDSGVAGDGITNVTTPVIAGSGVDGDTVTLYDGATAIGTATVSDGMWSVTTGTLSAGLHAIHAIQTSPAGDMSAASGTLDLTIDPAAPAPTSIIQTPASGLTGAAEPGTTITLQDDTGVLGSVSTGADGSWHFLPSTLSAGSYVVTATVTDVAGNVSAPSAPIAIAVAADHSFSISSASSGVVLTNHYTAADVLEQAVTTQPNGTAVSQTLDAAGTLLSTTTTGPTGLVLQSVTPTVTIRNIYDAFGTLIGTVTEAGSATGNAPPNYDTTGVIGGALTATDAVPNVVHLLGENQSLSLSGDDQVLLDAGNDTITASASSVSITGGSGTLTFFGGTGTSTVTGGTGRSTIAGGSGGGVFVGGSGGANLLVAGGGNTSLVGATGHDVLFGVAGNTVIYGSSSGSDSIVGGDGTNSIVAATNDVVFSGAGHTTVFGSAGGNDTVVGASAGGQSLIVAQGSGNEVFGEGGSDTMFSGSGNNILVGGSDTNILVGGAGSTVFVGGSGHSTIWGGSGNDTVWSGTGEMTAQLGGGTNTVVLQSGTADIACGAGQTIFDIVAGQGGGNDIIAGFKAGTDQIALFGYNTGATKHVSGGSTFISLSDGTHIELVGVTALASNSII